MTRDNDQLRAYTLYAMVYGSNVSIAIFGIAVFPVTDLPRFTKGYATSLAICILSPPMAYAIHRACGVRAARLKREAEAKGSIEYRPGDAPEAEAQYEDVDEKKGEKVIPQEGDLTVLDVPVSMVR
jgi:ACS family pantothenate transporter-like MFS transporter